MWLILVNRNLTGDYWCIECEDTPSITYADGYIEIHANRSFQKGDGFCHHLPVTWCWTEELVGPITIQWVQDEHDEAEEGDPQCGSSQSDNG